MPNPAKGALLWLRPASKGEFGKVIQQARWLILDGGRHISTGCPASARGEAEKRLAAYIAEKYEPERRERPLSEIRISDVLKIYLDDVAPGHARPEKTAERIGRLASFFGNKRLEEITGALCRSYTDARIRQNGGLSKGKGGAKRDLEDLRAAINHAHKEGIFRGIVRIVLPEKGKARQRWLTRSEFARLLWVCWRTREMQAGKATSKHPLRHLCRFLLLGLYTGSRPGAILAASWGSAKGHSFMDVEKRIFHRLPDGVVETNKRRPPVKIAPRLAAHLARWREMDGGKGPVVRFDGIFVQSVKTALGRAVELAGLEVGVTAYTLRHTAATWLVSKGVPIWDVAGFLGTSPEMIQKHYGHFAPDYQDRAAKEIGRK
jgi:integrase